jgi:hypothetical protein
VEHADGRLEAVDEVGDQARLAGALVADDRDELRGLEVDGALDDVAEDAELLGASDKRALDAADVERGAGIGVDAAGNADRRLGGRAGRR